MVGTDNGITICLELICILQYGWNW